MYTLEELPRNNKGIVWNKTKGMIVSMEYKGEYYKVKIENVFIKNNKSCLSISNNDNKIDILAGNFIKGKIGNLIGKKTSFYLFNIGQKVQTSNSSYLEILELNRSKKQKSYKYRCPIDGYIGEISESDLKKGVSCSVCSNQKIIKGINDIATTHPHLVKYFVNKEDAYKYSYGSKIKVKVKCPNCGYLKSMSINKLISRNKMTCRKCSDGISYPEKFLYSILEQLNIDFETQKIFDWSRNLDNKKLYDFYFKYDNKKVIIETHGSQHYDEKGFENLKGRTLKEEQENDKFKEQLARDNGITHYIQLDCRKSELKWIKNSILKSELNELLDLSNIDWEKCEKFACGSLIKEVSNLWNMGVKSSTIIGKELNIARTTACKYLKKSAEIGLCNYNELEVKESLKRKVRYIITGDIYTSLTQASSHTGYSIKYISKHCNGKVKNRKFCFV